MQLRQKCSMGLILVLDRSNIADALWRPSCLSKVDLGARNSDLCLAPENYFVIIRLTEGGGAAAGEMTNVSHVFQPEGRTEPPNSA
jgi:hypothetical protein